MAVAADEYDNGPTSDSPLAAALSYAGMGWRVVPIPPGAKHPELPEWQNRGTTDTDQIVTWWDATWPDHGIGILTGPESGIFVIDVDRHGDVDGADTLADLEATYEPLPPCPTVITGGLGEHRYMRHPPGVVIRNDAGRLLGPGLDIRADGGQVVAPPSLHSTGRHYCWDALAQPAPVSVLWPATNGALEPPEAPAWLLGLLCAPPPPRPTRAPSEPLSARPGDKWAAATDWGTLLAADGATFVGVRTDRASGHGYELWRRPGKEGGEASATVDYAGSDVLKVFTSNWPGLDQDATYTKFGFLAATRYAGDFGAARAAVQAQGFDFDTMDLADLLPAPGAHLPDSPSELGVWPLGHLFEGDVPAYDWLVPGLLERGDRAIITGAEGYGKSTLLRQLGLAASAGLNPWGRNAEEATHPPRRVLHIDAENSERQLRREFPKALGPIEDVAVVSDRFAVAIRPEGLVLDDPADKAGDRAWLAAAIAMTAPDLILIGPLYKLMGGDPNAEIEARCLTLYFDRVRTSGAGITVVIEAHAPHGERRPFGWSGLKRWPEIGLHLTPDGAMWPFRGCRDADRAWPSILARGQPGDWQWQAGAADSRYPLTPVADIIDMADREAQRDAQARQDVMRVLGRAKGPLSMTAITERVSRRKATTVAAVRHLQDAGWLLVDDSPSGAETFRLDPANLPPE